MATHGTTHEPHISRPPAHRTTLANLPRLTNAQAHPQAHPATLTPHPTDDFCTEPYDEPHTWAQECAIQHARTEQWTARGRGTLGLATLLEYLPWMAGGATPYKPGGPRSEITPTHSCWAVCSKKAYGKCCLKNLRAPYSCRGGPPQDNCVFAILFNLCRKFEFLAPKIFGFCKCLE